MSRFTPNASSRPRAFTAALTALGVLAAAALRIARRRLGRRRRRISDECLFQRPRPRDRAGNPRALPAHRAAPPRKYARDTTRSIPMSSTGAKSASAQRSRGPSDRLAAPGSQPLMRRQSRDAVDGSRFRHLPTHPAVRQRRRGFFWYIARDGDLQGISHRGGAPPAQRSTRPQVRAAAWPFFSRGRARLGAARPAASAGCAISPSSRPPSRRSMRRSITGISTRFPGSRIRPASGSRRGSGSGSRRGLPGLSRIVIHETCTSGCEYRGPGAPPPAP